MDSEKRISRREMLRNVGIAGAVAWAAPVLTSLPASASTSLNACKHYPPGCQGFMSCDSDPACACFTAFNKDGSLKPKGNCWNTLDGFCSSFQLCGGASGFKCPKPQKCISSCCPQNVCMTKCIQGKAQGPRKTPSRGSGPRVTR
jgi:hypothetical protein